MLPNVIEQILLKHIEWIKDDYDNAILSLK